MNIAMLIMTIKIISGSLRLVVYSLSKIDTTERF
jgi:hypothetical protein